jgi:hypothetical protein
MQDSKSEIIKVSAYWQDEVRLCWELGEHEPDLDQNLTIADFDVLHQRSWKVEK